MQFGDSHIVNTMKNVGERDYARRLLAEAAETIGTARQALRAARVEIASFDGPYRCGVLGVIDVALARLEGGG